jgi:hypothetical protein
VFGNKEKRQAADAALLAEIERLESLPLNQLATEVMTRGFGPGTPGAAGSTAVVGGSVKSGGASIVAYTGVSQIAKAFNRDGRDMTLIRRLHDVIAEGLQALEHAGLVRAEALGPSGTSSAGYVVTRVGADALQNDGVAHILVEGPPEPT